jgi:hypothetical protein
LAPVIGATLNFKTVSSFFFSDGFGAGFNRGKSRWDALDRRAICVGKKQWNSPCCPTEDGNAPRAGILTYDYHSIPNAWLPCDDHIAIYSV